MKELLLLSNSTNHGRTYLEHALKVIERFCGTAHRAIFIPYAGVDISWDDYTRRVASPFAGLGITVKGIHTLENPVAALTDHDLLLMGGGNTFHLLKLLYQHKLLDPIRKHVDSGKMKYIGWSAGSNVACPTIRTTNDMPIVEPPSFEALGLYPHQINPHYTEKTIPGHGGESRKQRLKEFITANPNEKVICLPEGTWIKVIGEEATYQGPVAGLMLENEQEDILLKDGTVID